VSPVLLIEILFLTLGKNLIISVSVEDGIERSIYTLLDSEYGLMMMFTLPGTSFENTTLISLLLFFEPRFVVGLTQGCDFLEWWQMCMCYPTQKAIAVHVVHQNKTEMEFFAKDEHIIIDLKQ